MVNNDKRQPAKGSLLKFLSVLVLAFLVAFVVSNQTYMAYLIKEARNDNYLFDRTIEWPDGSTEHVRIGKDGYFRIDGVKRSLIGMRLGTESPNLSGAFWENSNIELFERELSYLESVGIRVIFAHFPYAAAASLEEERGRYEGLMDQLTQHKMLVIAQIQNLSMENFGDLDNFDFGYGWWYTGEWGDPKSEDTVSQFTTRLATYLAPYDNLISFNLENEPNYYENNPQYSASRLHRYLNWLGRAVKPIIPDIPITVLLSQAVDDNPELAFAGLDATDWPVFTVYRITPEELDSSLQGELIPFMQSAGYSGAGWWAGEFNSDSRRPPHNISTARCTPEYIDSIFDNGCSLACLFCANRVNDPKSAWFDTDGDPVSQMKKVSDNLDRWQAPIGESPPSRIELLQTHWRHFLMP